MASFVESATLQVVDKSSSQLRSINRALRDLFNTANRVKRIPIKLDGIKQAGSQINRLTRDMERLRASQRGGSTAAAITSPTAAQVSRINEAATAMERYARAIRRAAAVRLPAQGTLGPGAATAATVARSANRLPPMSTTPFPGNLPTAFNIGTAYLTARAVHGLGREAITATLEAQATETRQNIILQSPELRELVKEIQRTAVRQAERVSTQRAGEIALDAVVGGLRGEIARTVVPRIAEREGQAQLLAPERAEDLTLLTNKILNLANATDDAQRSMALVDGVFKAAIVAGESFNAATTIAALRTSGFANTLDPEGLVGLSLAIDALGQRAGSSLKRLDKELFTPLERAGAGAGIAKGAVEALIKAGIRGEQGLTRDQAERFRADPARFIQTDIRKALEKLGVDVEDRVAVQQALSLAGFAETSKRLIADALSSIDEAARARTLVGNIDFDRSETAAAGDLGAALKDLTAQFQSFSAAALKPLFEVAAPLASSLASVLKELALAEGIGGQLERFKFALTAAAGAFALFKGGSSLVNSLFNPLNKSALALNGSAAALTRAAAVLGGSAALPDGTGGRRGGRARSVPAPLGTQGASASKEKVGLPGGSTNLLIAGAFGALNLALGELQRSIEISSLKGEERRDFVANERIAAQETGDAISRSIESVMDRLLGKTLTDTLVTRQTEIDKQRNVAASRQLTPPQEQQARTEEAQSLKAEIANLAKQIADARAAEKLPGSSDFVVAGLESQKQSLEQQLMALGTVSEGLGRALADGGNAIDQSAGKFEAVMSTGSNALNGNAMSFSQVFGTGAEQLKTVGPTIESAAQQFGPVASQGLLAAAPQIGSAIGAAAAAAINQNARVDVNVSAAVRQPDTGAAIPN